MDELNPHFAKVPTFAEGKINIEPFDRYEIYKRLDEGLVQWVQPFLVNIDFAERACGFAGRENTKCRDLENLCVERLQDTSISAFTVAGG